MMGPLKSWKNFFYQLLTLHSFGNRGNDCNLCNVKTTYLKCVIRHAFISNNNNLKYFHEIHIYEFISYIKCLVYNRFSSCYNVLVFIVVVLLYLFKFFFFFFFKLFLLL